MKVYSKRGSLLMLEFDRLHRNIAILMEQFEDKDLKTANEFIKKNIIGKNDKELESLITQPKTSKMKAQDICYEVIDLIIIESITDNNKEVIQKKLNEALKIYPKSIDALFLYSMTVSIEYSFDYIEKAIEIGDEEFGKIEWYTGERQFWVDIESRPYMRCLYRYVEILLYMNNYELAIETAEDLLIMNGIDNLGVRDYLRICYLVTGKTELFNDFDKFYKTDNNTLNKVCRALFLFKTKGKVKATEKKIKEVINFNPYLVDFIKEETLDTNTFLYSIGTKEELDAYCTEFVILLDSEPEFFKYVLEVNRA